MLRLLRLPLLGALLLLLSPLLRAGMVFFLTKDPSAHSAVKGILLVWQGCLLRSHEVVWFLPTGMVLTGFCAFVMNQWPRSRSIPQGFPDTAEAGEFAHPDAAEREGLPWIGRTRRSGDSATAALQVPKSQARLTRIVVGGTALLLLCGFCKAIFEPRFPVLAVIVVVALLFLQTVPQLGVFKKIAWIPGSELLFPRIFSFGRWKSGWEPLIAGFAAIPAMMLGMLIDVGSRMEQVVEDLAHWPDAYVDSRASVLDRVAPPAVFDFQDIDRVGDHLVVMGESPPRLIAYPIAGGPSASFPLQPFWANNTGMAVESVSDPQTGRTWVLTGEHTIGGAQYTGGQWMSLGNSPPAAPVLLHGAMFYFPERDEVGMITLNVAATHDAPQLITTDGNLRQVHVRNLRGRDGQSLPVTRDAIWIPPLRRFVLAPDFGDRLYLVDPEAGTGEPWLEMSTLNGRMVWDDKMERLFIARPERAEIAIVDVKKGMIERSISTERGVRALAVDSERGLLLTASVLSGAVEVLRISDGKQVDRFSGFMPMVRNLQLIPERGEAVLSCWSTLYRFPYAAP